MTPDQIRLLFPEFADSSDEEINAWLQCAIGQVCSAIFGKQTQCAIGFLTAHYLKISSDQGGRSGQLTGEKVGNLSRTYAAFPQFAATSDGLGTTSYGQQYLAIKSRVAAGKRRPLIAC